MSLLTDDEVPVFDIYFATVVGMNNHPGNTRDPVQRKPLVECAKQALEMVGIRRSILAQTIGDNENGN
tara:strand:+ start:153 stop:356 length:204 start_codon:yes stop_codon:yes gene_type:complete